MHFSLSAALSLLFATAVAAGACGGNVVVDTTTPTGGTGTGATTTTATTGFGAGTTTATVGSGGSTTFTTTTATASSTTSSSTSSTSSTTSTGTTMMGACTDPPDDKTFTYTVIFPIEVKCAMANLGNNAALDMCLLGNLGVTTACEACVDAELQCSIQHCASQCISNPGSQNCTGCREMSCGPAFVACSGRSHDTGITSCSSVLGNGPGSSPWQRGLDAADFTTQAAQSAYQGFDACACGTNPCASLCGGSYCMGQLASPACGSCVKTNCGMAWATCETN